MNLIKSFPENVSKYKVYENEFINKYPLEIVKCTNTQDFKDTELQAIVIKLDFINFILEEIHYNIELLIQCQSPYVQKIYGYQQKETTVYIITEKIELTLDKQIIQFQEQNKQNKQNKYFSKDQVVQIIEQIIKGYIHLKQLNIIHGFIRPENISIENIFNDKYLVKLCNIGVWNNVNKVLNDQNNLMAKHKFYQAPEINEQLQYQQESQIQFKLQPPPTDLGDIFSLGHLIFTLCNRGDLLELPQNWQSFQQQLQTKSLKLQQIGFIQDLNQIIEQMIIYDQYQRIKWEDIEIHPKFQSKQIIKNNYYIDLTEQLGSGNQGAVFKAYKYQNKQVIQELCAKKLDRVTGEGKKEMGIFEKIKFLGIRKCNNIIEQYGFILDKQYAYILLEKCDKNLEKYCRDQGQLTKQSIIDILAQIIEGYSFLNQLGIIHRDLKPQNILIKKEMDKDIVKIIDFGVGKILTQGTNLTKTLAGTPLYTAPEILNEKEYSDSCDVFSLGVMLYEMIFMKHLFEVQSMDQLKAMQIQFFRENRWNCPKPPYQEFQDLIQLMQNMLKYNSNERITWKQLKEHSLIQSSQLISKQQYESNNIQQQNIKVISNFTPQNLKTQEGQNNNNFSQNNKIRFSTNAPTSQQPSQNNLIQFPQAQVNQNFQNKFPLQKIESPIINNNQFQNPKTTFESKKVEIFIPNQQQQFKTVNNPQFFNNQQNNFQYNQVPNNIRAIKSNQQVYTEGNSYDQTINNSRKTNNQ